MSFLSSVNHISCGMLMLLLAAYLSIAVYTRFILSMSELSCDISILCLFSSSSTILSLFSSSPLDSSLLTLTVAAYPLFFKVLLRCLMLFICSLVIPFVLRIRFSSFTLNVTSSSSVIEHSFPGVLKLLCEDWTIELCTPVCGGKVGNAWKA